MNLQKQTQLHDPAAGVMGNCVSAVVASLLEIPIADVPTFPGPDQAKRLNAWLRPRGLAYVAIGLGDGQWLRDFGIQGLHHEIGGTSPRHAASGVGHSCVGIDGALAFDPHPSDAGLTNADTIGVFVLLEPWRFKV